MESFIPANTTRTFLFTADKTYTALNASVIGTKFHRKMLSCFYASRWKSWTQWVIVGGILVLLLVLANRTSQRNLYYANKSNGRNFSLILADIAGEACYSYANTDSGPRRTIAMELVIFYQKYSYRVRKSIYSQGA